MMVVIVCNPLFSFTPYFSQLQKAPIYRGTIAGHGAQRGFQEISCFLRPRCSRCRYVTEPLQTTESCAFSDALEDMLASRCWSGRETSAINRRKNSLRFFQNTSFM